MDADVIVVGAGPAGSTTARLCALAGLETILMDRAVFPREKPCGGGLSPRAVADLARLFDLGTEAERAPLGIARHGFRAHFYRPARVATPPAPGWTDYRRLRVVSAQPLAHVTRRDVLDAYLLTAAVQAGARALTGVEVLAWRQTGGGLSVTARRAKGGAVEALEFRSRFLVGADGAASVVALPLRRADRTDAAPMAVCLSLFIPLDSEGLTRACPGGDLDFHFGLVAGGYGWVFPAATGVAVGTGALAAPRGAPRLAGVRRGRADGPDRDGLRSRLVVALDRLLGLYPGLSAPAEPVGAGPAGSAKTWLVPLGGYRRPWAEGRVLLVGDAAGVANPLTGEGIGPAVRSAELAAAVIVEWAGREARASLAVPGHLVGRDRQLMAATLGQGGASAPGVSYVRRLWTRQVSRQRTRLWAATAAGHLAPARQAVLFRRPVLAGLVEELRTGGPG